MIKFKRYGNGPEKFESGVDVFEWLAADRQFAEDSEKEVGRVLVANARALLRNGRRIEMAERQ